MIWKNPGIHIRIEMITHMKIQYDSVLSEKSYIKKKTNALRNERLQFKGGELLGDVLFSVQSGSAQRKIRRIIEKRVSQDFWANRGSLYSPTNYPRQKVRRNTRNQMRNIFGAAM